MVLVHVTISPKGIHQAEVEARMDEEEPAREFYSQLKPLLEELSRAIQERVSPDSIPKMKRCSVHRET